jgi:urease accessory protein
MTSHEEKTISADPPHATESSATPFLESGAYAVASQLDGFVFANIHDAASLEAFLSRLLSEAIGRFDLPVIRWAYERASQNDSQALMELDQFFSSAPVPEPLRSASQRIGRAQLQGLAGMKGHRFLSRYRAAVESQPLAGYHVTVYGIFLYLFSIPLRQGLAGYAYQALNGFLAAAAAPLGLGREQKQALLDKICATVPQLIERSLVQQREATKIAEQVPCIRPPQPDRVNE